MVLACIVVSPMLKSSLSQEFPFMSEANARQKAEDHYYAALDLMADGKLEEAVAAYRESLAADPAFTEAMHGLARALQDRARHEQERAGSMEELATFWLVRRPPRRAASSGG